MVGTSLIEFTVTNNSCSIKLPCISSAFNKMVSSPLKFSFGVYIIVSPSTVSSPLIASLTIERSKGSASGSTKVIKGSEVSSSLIFREASLTVGALFI